MDKGLVLIGKAIRVQESIDAILASHGLSWSKMDHQSYEARSIVFSHNACIGHVNLFSEMRLYSKDGAFDVGLSFKTDLMLPMIKLMLDLNDGKWSTLIVRDESETGLFKADVDRFVVAFADYFGKPPHKHLTDSVAFEIIAAMAHYVRAQEKKK